MGSSPNERFWTQQLRDAVQPLNSRVRFTWWNDLSFEEMLNLSASLPTGTAILFGLLSVDAAGVPLEQGDAVGRLHAVANAPIFSYVDAYFGRGIVGGPMISVADVSREAADVVERILRGTPPDAIKVPAIGFAPPKFDWRELQRWNIQDANLPAGSKVYFRVPSAFEQFRWYILSVVAFVLLQTAFIGALLLNRRRLERETTERKLAEEATRDLSGRLISAQEDERARLARELHDDVTQRLALLAIDAGQVERISGMSGHVGGIQKIRAGLVRLSEDVHALSYQLHPSVLDDLGLVEALKAECDRFARLESISVHARITDFNNDLSSNAALGIFRIAQEALRNIGRHAKASEVEVHLGVVDSNLQLKVCDNGAGFDSERPRGRRSLGLASMQQRTRVLGGELRVESAPGRGTTVWAEVPLQEKRSESPTAAAG
jgi:signal transduction histidine kinase